MSATVAVYAALSIQYYLFFLGKSHFGNIYIYNKLIAYVTRKNNPPDFNHIESTLLRLKMLKKLALKLTNEKIRYFPGPQNETVSNLFGDVLSRSFNVIGQFMKNVAFFCSQLALWLVNFLPSGPVRVAAL